MDMVMIAHICISILTHDAIYGIHNSAMDIHKLITVIHNSVMDIYKFWQFMDIHTHPIK